MGRRGRPKGSTGPRKIQVAVQAWKPRHDQIVLLHLAGYDNTEIAANLEISAQNVSDILGDPKAVELIARGREKVKAALLTEIDGRLVGLAHKSIDNLQKTIDAKIPVQNRMKIHQDKLGVDLLKMIGYGDRDGKETDGGSRLSEEVARRLATALERSENRGKAVDLSESTQILEAEIIEESAA